MLALELLLLVPNSINSTNGCDGGKKSGLWGEYIFKIARFTKEAGKRATTKRKNPSEHPPNEQTKDCSTEELTFI